MVELNRLNVAALYVATFDRAADAAGLDYWMNNSGLTTMLEIEKAFMANDEAKAIVGMENREAVEYLYDNLFNKAPADDVAGINYWVSALDSGTVEIEVLILALYAGALGDDKTIMTNKAEVSLAFADAGLDNVNQASDVMQGITADPATVTAANEQIQLWQDEGEGFELTTGEDDIPGSPEDNVIEGAATESTLSSTYQSFDNIDGGAGNDTLNLRVSGGTATLALIATASMENVETVNITDASVSAAMVFEGANVNGVEHITLNGPGNFGGIELLRDLNDIAEVTLNQTTSQSVGINYAPSVIAGTNDHQVINLNTNATMIVGNTNATGAVVGGMEVLDLHTGTGAQTLVNFVAPSVTIDGAGNLALFGGIGARSIDGSAATGNLTIDASAVSTLAATVVTGSGNDVIFSQTTGVATAAGYTLTVDAGAGDDQIDLGSAQMSTASFSNVSGGAGRDKIWLDVANDTVSFANTGDTGSTLATADVVFYFGTSGVDRIDFDTLAPGASGVNFTATGGTTSYAMARNNAELNLLGAGDGMIYDFGTDGTDGYLFVDANDDGIIDGMVVLTGVVTGSFTSGNIIA